MAIDAQISKGLSRISLVAYAHGSLLTTNVPKYSLLYNLDLKMSQSAKTIDATQIQKNWKKAQETAAAKNIEKVLKSLSTSQALRISSIVAFLELINFGSKGGKALNDPNWENSTAAIAGMFSLTAATLDIANKGMHALSFAEKAEKIKVYGGCFTVAGSTFSTILSFAKLADTFKSKDPYGFILSIVSLGISVSILAVGTGMLFTLPVLQGTSLIINIRKIMIVDKLLRVNMIGLAARLNWLGIVITFIELFIQYYGIVPNELQKWCDKSAFGLDKAKFSSSKEEQEAFSDALQSI